MKVKAVAGIFSLMGVMVAGSVLAAPAFDGSGGYAAESSQWQDSGGTGEWQRERLNQQTRSGSGKGEQHRFQYQHQHRRQTGGERMKWEGDGMEGNRNGSRRH